MPIEQADSQIDQPHERKADQCHRGVGLQAKVSQDRGKADRNSQQIALPWDRTLLYLSSNKDHEQQQVDEDSPLGAQKAIEGDAVHKNADRQNQQENPASLAQTFPMLG